MSKGPNYREEALSIMTLCTLIYTESISGFVRGSQSGDSRSTPLVSRCDMQRRKMLFNEIPDSRVSLQPEQRLIGPLVNSLKLDASDIISKSWHHMQPRFMVQMDDFFSPFYQCLICCHFSPVFYIISRRCGSLRHHFDELPPPDDHIKSHSSFISSLFARMDPYHVPLIAAKHYSLFSLNHVLTNELFVYIICNCQYEGHSVY